MSDGGLGVLDCCEVDVVPLVLFPILGGHDEASQIVGMPAGHNENLYWGLRR